MIYEDIYFILIGTGMKSCSKLSNIAENNKENSEKERLKTTTLKKYNGLSNASVRSIHGCCKYSISFIPGISTQADFIHVKKFFSFSRGD